jgi:probable HAF family extracellular repeat protein
MSLSVPTNHARLALRAATVALTAAALAVCGDDPVAPLASPESAVLLAPGGAFSVTTIDVPGALATTPQGVSADGAVVGSFQDARGTHGFLLRGGAVTTLDYPGATLTMARGIASDGTIVGSYRLPGEPAVNLHGFRRTPQGEFLKADFPGHTSTIPQRVLDDGTILGCRHDADQMETMRGVAIRPGGNSETDAFASMHNGATPDRRRVVGLYTNMTVGGAGRGEGYVIDDGTFKPVVVPGSTVTNAWDVSPRGDVVGVFRDAAGVFHGYVLTRDGYRPIDAPGATATRAFGINASGDVVGAFVDAGGTTHGFLARGAR